MDSILVLGGGFNPVHTQHLAGMELMRQEIERRTQFRILGGYLAPSTNQYVQQKLGKEAMSARHRLAMCNLAIAGSDWIFPCSKPFYSGPQCGKQMRLHEGIVILAASGADRVLGKSGLARWRTKRTDGVVSVCLGRGPETAQVAAAFQQDRDAGLVPDPDGFFMIEQQVRSLSSTAIRAELSKLHQATDPTHKRRIADQLVEGQFLHAAVADYILQHEADLYLSDAD